MFNVSFSSSQEIGNDIDVIFVSDLFVEDYVGGAELTSEALISNSKKKVHKLRSKDVTLELIKNNLKKYGIFGNFSGLNPALIPVIISNLNYSIIEYDYKFCKYRSQEKHSSIENTQCNCNQTKQGEVISAFFYYADLIFWMSKNQSEKHFAKFPVLKNKKNVILSSVFNSETLEKLVSLRKTVKSDKWIVLGSNSWVKGADAAENWCKQNNVQYEVVWNVEYFQLLEKLASAKGFVYLPNGSDTCPRMVIEAKILGCDLILNDYVQHSTEDWFNSSIDEIVDYLKSRPDVFWNEVNKYIEKQFTISGYTTTYNCVSQKYPFEQSIRSMLGFCDEVIVVDGDSTDETVEILQKLQTEFSNLKIFVNPIDFNSERFSVLDGRQKAEARSKCTGDFCWQQDSDEIVHEDDYSKIKNLVKELPKNIQVLALPVIEYWGGYDKVRVDVNPWKWRLSRNHTCITHGIPAALRKFDANGKLYSAPGSDGCDMIYSDTHEPVPFANFMTEQVNQVRFAALNGNKEALIVYQDWLNQVASNIPGVYHYSWFDMVRKIKTYRDYWTKHWNDIEGKEYVDTAETNMMFDVPWSQVTENMIVERAKQFCAIGGWIWHKKWDGRITPWVKIDKLPPRIMSVLNNS